MKLVKNIVIRWKKFCNKLPSHSGKTPMKEEIVKHINDEINSKK
tara:strand:- start:557 stop:688 length:132 start_codon:yes stop_codon:yes gene_type:complete